MTVYDDDSQIVDLGLVVLLQPSYWNFSNKFGSLRYYRDIDVAFFVVTVDLWSADGKKETNLVLHPSSADRYIPTNITKQPRRRPTGPPVPQRGSEPQSSQVGLAKLLPPSCFVSDTVASGGPREYCQPL